MVTLLIKLVRGGNPMIGTRIQHQNLELDGKGVIGWIIITVTVIGSKVKQMS